MDLQTVLSQRDKIDAQPAAKQTELWGTVWQLFVKPKIRQGLSTGDLLAAKKQFVGSVMHKGVKPLPSGFGAPSPEKTQPPFLRAEPSGVGKTGPLSREFARGEMEMFSNISGSLGSKTAQGYWKSAEEQIPPAPGGGGIPGMVARNAPSFAMSGVLGEGVGEILPGAKAATFLKRLPHGIGTATAASLPFTSSPGTAAAAGAIFGPIGAWLGGLGKTVAPAAAKAMEKSAAPSQTAAASEYENLYKGLAKERFPSVNISKPFGKFLKEEVPEKYHKEIADQVAKKLEIIRGSEAAQAHGRMVAEREAGFQKATGRAATDEEKRLFRAKSDKPYERAIDTELKKQAAVKAQVTRADTAAARAKEIADKRAARAVAKATKPTAPATPSATQMRAEAVKSQQVAAEQGRPLSQEQVDKIKTEAGQAPPAPTAPEVAPHPTEAELAQAKAESPHAFTATEMVKDAVEPSKEVPAFSLFKDSKAPLSEAEAKLPDAHTIAMKRIKDSVADAYTEAQKITDEDIRDKRMGAILKRYERWEKAIQKGEFELPKAGRPAAGAAPQEASRATKAAERRAVNRTANVAAGKEAEAVSYTPEIAEARAAQHAQQGAKPLYDSAMQQLQAYTRRALTQSERTTLSWCIDTGQDIKTAIDPETQAEWERDHPDLFEGEK